MLRLQAVDAIHDIIEAAFFHQLQALVALDKLHALVHFERWVDVQKTLFHDLGLEPALRRH